MYQLMVLMGTGPEQQIRIVKAPSDQLEQLTAERDAMNKTLLSSGLRLDQARTVVRPVFKQCEPGTCRRCDEARLDGSHLNPQFRLLS